jgi:hypothetical protein
MSLIFANLLLVSCEIDQSLFRPAVGDVPYLYDIGELPVIRSDVWSSGYWDPEGDGPFYGQIGAPSDPGVYGGVTFSFTGTGGEVCVVMDPEAVFWNQFLAPDAGRSDYLYADRFRDDADMDMDVGLTAFYTGSPGSVIGDFEVPYEDPLGEVHYIAFDECEQATASGEDGHAGRASTESCTIDTSTRGGVSYTGVVRTFSLPVDDDVANFSIAVLEGACDGADECTLLHEYTLGELEPEMDCEPGTLDASVVDPEGSYCGSVAEAGTGLYDECISQACVTQWCANPENEMTFSCLEQQFCGGKKAFNDWCEANFDDYAGDAWCVDNGVERDLKGVDDTGISI